MCEEKRDVTLKKMKNPLLNMPSGKRGQGEDGEWSPVKSRSTPVGESNTKTNVGRMKDEAGSIGVGGRGFPKGRGTSLPLMARAKVPNEGRDEEANAGPKEGGGEKEKQTEQKRGAKTPLQEGKKLWGCGERGGEEPEKPGMESSCSVTMRLSQTRT